MWLLVAAGFAGPPTDSFPLRAQVQLPASGVHRIRVPPALLAGDEAVGAHNLLLLDADGEVVPIGVVTPRPITRHRFVARRQPGDTPLSVWPLDTSGDRYELRVQDGPLSGLEVELPDSGAAVRVKLLDAASDELLHEQLLWTLGEAHSEPLPMPPRTGTFIVELERSGREALNPSFHGLRGGPARLERVPLTVGPPQQQDDGWIRYDLGAEHPWRLKTLDVDVDASLFSRRATVRARPQYRAPDELPEPNTPNAWRSLRRVELGGWTIDDTTLPVASELSGAPLALYVASDDAPALAIRSAEGRFPGLDVVLRNPGRRGPFTLYAGGDGYLDSGEADELAEVLAAEAGPALAPGPVEPNPGFVPPEVRGRLGDPGGPLDDAAWGWSRSVEGAVGLARIPLDDTVLTTARADLGDLRLLTEGGRQVPYVLRGPQRSTTWGELPFERREDGRTSLLTVQLPQPGIPVASVTIATDAPHFERQIRVARVDGGELRTLRAYTWRRSRGLGALTLDVHQPVGEQLVLIIENGDDAPLPVTSVRVDRRSWELLAVLPDEPVRLRYGNPQADRPSYDLAMVAGLLDRRVDATATLGPATATGRPPLAWLDRVMLGVGIAVMSLGLLALVVLLLVRGDPPEEVDSEDDGAAPAGDGDAGDADDADGAEDDAAADDDEDARPAPPPQEPPPAPDRS